MKIEVNYKPSDYRMVAGEFMCEHVDTYTDTVEHYDHYTEAVTGMPQSLSYEPIEVCEECNAYYSGWSEEWYDER